jgi:hypothetical protein
MHLQRDPAFAIESTNWDTFSRWEVRPDRCAGYLGDVDWDRSWEPVVSSDDEDEDKDDDDDMAEDEDEDDDDSAKTPPPPPPRFSGEVSDQIYNGGVVRDDTDDMINHVVYHYFQDADRGEVYQMPPELTEEEELVVAVLISKEEERRVELRAFPELADTLVLSVVPPPPMQPPHTPPASHGTPGPELHQGGRRARRLSWVGLPGCPPPHQGLRHRP